MDVKPGQILKYEGKWVQVVWVGSFNVLMDYRIQLTKAVQFFYLKSGKFKTIIVGEKDSPWEGEYYFSKESIGKDGL